MNRIQQLGLVRRESNASILKETEKDTSKLLENESLIFGGKDTMKTWKKPNYGSYNCVTCYENLDTDYDNLRSPTIQLKHNSMNWFSQVSLCSLVLITVPYNKRQG